MGRAKMKFERERVKTIILNTLIGISLILSIFLWTSAPRLDNLKPSDYVVPQLIGHKYEVTDVIHPSSIVFHNGDGRHMKALIESNLYKKIATEMNKWNFDNFEDTRLTKAEWETLVNKKKTIEVIYKYEIPADIADELFTIRGRGEGTFRSLSRILLYENKEKNAVYALLLSDQNGHVIRAHTSIVPGNMEKWFTTENLSGLSEQMMYRMFIEDTEDGMKPTPYVLYNPLYLPKERGKMTRYRYFYQPLTVQQVLDAMFVDASLTRQVTERDGTMIYTNGSQSVSIPARRNYLLYRHPIHESESGETEQTNYEALSSALSFVNQHGGWGGRYYLENINEADEGNKEEAVTYRFRQYVGSYPLFGNEEMEQNVISVRVSEGDVSELYYPMQQLDLYFERIPVTIVSGPELIKWLDKKGMRQDQIQSIELGLYTRSIYDFIEMKPCWVIYMKDRNPLYVEADAALFGK
jgi:regulatory protein YycH of two-component signal transduction system YycFG